MKAADQLDPDNQWRQAFRMASRTNDRPALLGLAKHSDINLQPDVVVVELASELNHSSDEGENQTAGSLLRALLQKDPSSFWAHFGLGSLLAEAQDRKTGNAMVESEEGGLVTLSFRSNEPSSRRRDYDEAIGHLITAAALRPQLAGAWLQLGSRLGVAGRIEEAIGADRKAIALRPELAAAHSNLGIALRKAGKLEEGVAALRKAVDLEPDAVAYINLGSALAAAGNVEEAIAVCRKAVELNPVLASAHASLGNALSNADRLEEAIAACRKAIELKPELAPAHYNLGVYLRKACKMDEAIAAFRKAIELKPDYAEAHGNLGFALLHAGEVDDALAACRKAVELKPDDEEAHVNLGPTLLNAGMVDEAIEACRKAIELNPDLVQAHNNLGVALLLAGSFSSALEAFDRAMGRDKTGDNSQSIGNAELTKQLLQLEVSFVAKLKAEFSGRKSPALAAHEAVLDEIYRQLPTLPPASPATRQNYAQTHREMLAGALKKVTIRTITIPKHDPEGSADAAVQRKLAETIRREAAVGKDFGDLAKLHSKDSAAGEGGRREINHATFIPAFRDAVFALKPREMSKVLEDDDTYYLFRMEQRKPADAKAIDLEDKEVQQVIATLMAEERAEARKAKYFQQCVEKARAAK